MGSRPNARTVRSDAGTASAEGRPEELGFDAGRVKDRLLRLLELASHLGGFEAEDQVGMVPGVAADGMPGIDDGTRDLGLLLHESAHEKERRLHAVSLQHFHHAPGVGVVRAVVVGERHQARAARQTDERPAVELRGRRHGVVTRHRGEPRHTQSAEKSCKHVQVDCSWARAHSLLNTCPLCITNFTRPSSVMSFSGSPCTAITSA